MMKVIDFSFETPEENLALEEVLLQPFVKNSNVQPLIRFWENVNPCVIIGRGEHIEKQVHLNYAEEHSVKVIRRISGGGTVLHGPNNLNVSFFLPFSFQKGLENIHESYCIILSYVQKAIENLTEKKVDIKGTCDLVIGEKKFSGTAQSRKRFGILHHLTLLWETDYELMRSLLKEPEKRPEYRGDRDHRDFVTTFKEEGFSFSLKDFKVALLKEFEETEPYELSAQEYQSVTELVEKRYSKKDWNFER